MATSDLKHTGTGIRAVVQACGVLSLILAPAVGPSSSSRAPLEASFRRWFWKAPPALPSPGGRLGGPTELLRPSRWKRFPCGA